MLCAVEITPHPHAARLSDAIAWCESRREARKKISRGVRSGRHSRHTEARGANSGSHSKASAVGGMRCRSRSFHTRMRGVIAGTREVAH